ncbi:hypothetical protein VTI74DRAFT_5729 [Chaetomium olivicolor]
MADMTTPLLGDFKELVETVTHTSLRDGNEAVDESGFEAASLPSPTPSLPGSLQRSTSVVQYWTNNRRTIVKTMETVIAQLNAEVGIKLPPTVKTARLGWRKIELRVNNTVFLVRFRDGIRKLVERSKKNRLRVDIVGCPVCRPLRCAGPLPLRLRGLGEGDGSRVSHFFELPRGSA